MRLNHADHVFKPRRSSTTTTAATTRSGLSL